MIKPRHINRSESKRECLAFDSTLLLPIAMKQKKQKEQIKRAYSYSEQTEGNQQKEKSRRATADDNLLKNKADNLIFNVQNEPLKQQKRKRKSTDQRSCATLPRIPKDSSATTASLTTKRKHKTQKVTKGKERVMHAHSFLMNESDYDESADTQQKKRLSNDDNQRDDDCSEKCPIPGFLQFQVPIIDIQQPYELENDGIEKYSFESIMKRLHKSMSL